LGVFFFGELRPRTRNSRDPPPAHDLNKTVNCSEKANAQPLG
jgi:hypothetical protein